MQAKRDEAVRKATASTPLAAAGLSPHALSTALGKLGVSTAGELARVPARRITVLRGIGSRPRYELVRRSREWRQRFNLAEAEIQEEGKAAARSILPNGPGLLPRAAPHPSGVGGTAAGPRPPVRR